MTIWKNKERGKTKKGQRGKKSIDTNDNFTTKKQNRPTETGCKNVIVTENQGQVLT